MKEATGELSMTTITIIAVIAIAGVIAFVIPLVRDFINESWDNLSKVDPTKKTTTYVEVIDGNVEM